MKLLTAADMEVLEFARARWGRTGPKEAVVLERFGISLVQYHQRLNQVLSDPAAEVYDPQLVRRLRRIRDQRHVAGFRRPSGSIW